MPRVSVVIPAYGAARYIEATLDSVAAQTYRDFEVVVVDDGSPDDTKPVVDAWLARSGTPGTCVRRPNGRIAAARNTGLRESSGELVALLDADDFWMKDKLARVVAEFDAHPETVLVCHDIEVVKEGRVLRIERAGPPCPSGQDMYERLLFIRSRVSTSAATFRRDKALEIGAFRENPEFNSVEDYDFWLRLSRTGPFRFVEAVLSTYTVLPESASRKVEYHHANLESLLKDHFASRFGPHPGPLDRLHMRRRLSFAYRSAVAALLESADNPALRRAYVARMLAAWPFSPKNIGRALQSALAELAGR